MEEYANLRLRQANSVTFMNDVHYYIPQIPTTSFNSKLYVTGLMFEPNTGYYNLPCNEGVYKVYSTDGF